MIFFFFFYMLWPATFLSSKNFPTCNFKFPIPDMGRYGEKYDLVNVLKQQFPNRFPGGPFRDKTNASGGYVDLDLRNAVL